MEAGPVRSGRDLDDGALREAGNEVGVGDVDRVEMAFLAAEDAFEEGDGELENCSALLARNSPAQRMYSPM